MEGRFGSFVWDHEKEAANLRKHGVNFETAAHVFQDPQRKIFTDERHGKIEERFFCIGKVGDRVLTVRLGRRYYEQKDA